MRLDVKGFSLTCALVWGLGLPLLTWWIMAFDGASTDPTWLGRVYRGYNLTFTGSLIGAAWAFIDGLIGGGLFAWLYNRLEDRILSPGRVHA
jgi:hypothetical protein